MKLRIIASRNPSAIMRNPPPNWVESEEDEEDKKDEEDSKSYDVADDGIPQDTGNWLPSGGRIGKPELDSYFGYKSNIFY